MLRRLSKLGDVNTDWQDEVFRTAPITGHSLSVSGGTETTRYSLSGNYLMHQGIVKNSDFNRAGIRANIEQKLGKKVTVGALINASRSSSSNASVNQMNGSRWWWCHVLCFRFWAIGPCLQGRRQP